jgi:hypothetical protein
MFIVRETATLYKLKAPKRVNTPPPTHTHNEKVSYGEQYEAVQSGPTLQEDL